MEYNNGDKVLYCDELYMYVGKDPIHVGLHILTNEYAGIVIANTGDFNTYKED